MKWTPLQLACLTRDNTFLDDFCTFEIQSPNRKHCLIIRVAVQSAEKWFNALMASIEATINDAMEKANSALTGKKSSIFWGHLYRLLHTPYYQALLKWGYFNTAKRTFRMLPCS